MAYAPLGAPEVLLQKRFCFCLGDLAQAAFPPWQGASTVADF